MVIEDAFDRTHDLILCADIKLYKKGVFSTVLVMTSLAEFGDKTQLAVIALTAQYRAPVSVYVGAVLAFALIVGIGVLLGKKIGDKVEARWIILCSGVLFLILGALFIIEALI